MFDVCKFKGCVISRGYTLEDIARELKIHSATLYRKINRGGDFSRDEIQTIKKYLQLDAEEANNIFFAVELTEMQERK